MAKVNDPPITREELQERLWKLCGRVYDDLGFHKRRDAIEWIEEVVSHETLKQTGK